MSFEDILRNRITRLLKQKSFREALDLCEEFQGIHGLDQESQGYILECLIGLGQFEEARTMGDLLCHQYPYSARILYLGGKIHFRSKGYEQSEEYLRRHLQIYPNAFGEYWLAKCLIAQGSLDEAFSILNRLDPQSPFILKELGWLFERRKDFQAAFGYYRKAHELQPDSSFLQEKTEALQALLTDKEKFLDEMDTLGMLEEEVPDHLFPAFFQRNLEAGNQEKMRHFYQQNKTRFTPVLFRSVGWVCYHAKCYDLAFLLFSEYFESSQSDLKLLNAMQFAARMSRKTEFLIETLSRHARKTPALFGRIKKIKKSLNKKL